MVPLAKFSYGHLFSILLFPLLLPSDLYLYDNGNLGILKSYDVTCLTYFPFIDDKENTSWPALSNDVFSFFIEILTQAYTQWTDNII